MRPDRIVVGEIRDEAAVDMLQAMNTGHDGSMTTAHSNSPRDTLARIETMTMMAGMDLPVRAIREQVSSAIDLVCHQERLRDGTRKIVNITEVSGMEGEVITMTDIFVFEQTGYDGTARSSGGCARPACGPSLWTRSKPPASTCRHPSSGSASAGAINSCPPLDKTGTKKRMSALIEGRPWT
jgi:hypothetical protein